MITDIAYTELGFQNLTKKPVTYFDNDYTEDERGFYFAKIISPKRVTHNAHTPRWRTDVGVPLISPTIFTFSARTVAGFVS